MAKTMAALENGDVVNMIWCRDGEPETDTLKNVDDRPVGIGDTYADGKFYRDDAEILTPLEEARKEAGELQGQLDSLSAAYTEGVNSV